MPKIAEGPPDTHHIASQLCSSKVTAHLMGRLWGPDGTNDQQAIEKRSETTDDPRIIDYLARVWLEMAGMARHKRSVVKRQSADNVASFPSEAFDISCVAGRTWEVPTDTDTSVAVKERAWIISPKDSRELRKPYASPVRYAIISNRSLAMLPIDLALTTGRNSIGVIHGGDEKQSYSFDRITTASDSKVVGMPTFKASPSREQVNSNTHAQIEVLGMVARMLEPQRQVS